MTVIPLNTSELPTHLARVASRLKLIGADSSSDTFLASSYLFESAIKTIATSLWSGIRFSAPDHAYAIAFKLFRADGLGDWESAIQLLSSQPLAGYLNQSFSPLLSWLTQKRKPPSDDWFIEAISACDSIISRLGFPSPPNNKPRTIRNLINSLVFIRNKTKAHGAIGPDTYNEINNNYLIAVSTLVMRCPIFKINWMHLSVRLGKDKVKGILLKGPEPVMMRDSECEIFSPRNPGIYFSINKSINPYSVGDFIKSSLECRSFFLPNGGYSQSGNGEFIDYASGDVKKFDLSKYEIPPASLPPSETEGVEELDVQSNIFGNLPAPPRNYIERSRLQEALLARLLDKNHTIITLHGRGGIGKTSLALWAAHSLSKEDKPVFESIIWFSARDVDLKQSGPSSVRQAVSDLKSICDSYGKLFRENINEDSFANILRTPAENGTGKLFIFDNFETLSDARQVHKFLDSNTYLPNKVLITSRERAYKADYPIEVRGMEYDEAERLIKVAGHELGIMHILSDKIITSIHKYTDGHAYVMRLIVGEIAKEGKYVPPKSLLPHRIDIVNAVFERSFNKLSPDGKRVFLLATNWRSAISELALIIICAEHELNAEIGTEECERLSLLSSEIMPDGSSYYWAPELARIFGKKKLDSDPDRLIMQEDLNMLRKFGVIKPNLLYDISKEDIVGKFINVIIENANLKDEKGIQRLNDVLENIAELYPHAWFDLAKFRIKYIVEREQIEHALRRLVEEFPNNKSAWILRAEFAQKYNDESTYISSLVSAVDADPNDIDLIRETAYQLCRFIDAHKDEIPMTRRGVYLAGVRSHMERLAEKFDATGLSRLAWLFLLEENWEKALRYASLGLSKDKYDKHCTKIVARLKKS